MSNKDLKTAAIAGWLVAAILLTSSMSMNHEIKTLDELTLYCMESLESVRSQIEAIDNFNPDDLPHIIEPTGGPDESI